MEKRKFIILALKQWVLKVKFLVKQATRIRRNIDMEEVIPVDYSASLVDKISAKDILYAEIADGGAMGVPGRIIFYFIDREKLFGSETNLSIEESSHIEKFLLSHQDYFCFENIPLIEKIFNYYYGGCGNHVFINKYFSPDAFSEFIVLKKNKKNYKVDCSSIGVFDEIKYIL